MLDGIVAKLKEIDSNVQKGIPRKDGDLWNSLVVKKNKISFERHNQTMYVSVRIVREDEIEDGLVEQVIDAMQEIGWKVSGDRADYDYVVDQNEVIVEVCTINFFDPAKRC